MANEPKHPPKPKTPRKPKTPNVVKAEGAPAAPAPAPEARKRGRPSKYDPAMCDLVLELGEQGKSKVQIARSLGVHPETMTEWGKVHPEFSASIKEAQALAQAWWEDAGQDGIKAGPGMFNATAFIFQVKNRFRDDYRDQQDHNVNPGEGFAKLFSLVGSGKADALLGGNQ
jgi:transposase-like protein